LGRPCLLLCRRFASAARRPAGRSAPPDEGRCPSRPGALRPHARTGCNAVWLPWLRAPPFCFPFRPDMSFRACCLAAPIRRRRRTTRRAPRVVESPRGGTRQTRTRHAPSQPLEPIESSPSHQRGRRASARVQRVTRARHRARRSVCGIALAMTGHGSPIGAASRTENPHPGGRAPTGHDRPRLSTCRRELSTQRWICDIVSRKSNAAGCSLQL